MPDCLQLLMWCGRFKYKRHTYLSTRQLEYLMKDPQCNENVDIMTIRNTNCKMKMFRFNLSFMASSVSLSWPLILLHMIKLQVILVSCPSNLYIYSAYLHSRVGLYLG